MSDKYDVRDAISPVHHSPQEGFDPTEPEAARISFFVIGSVILLVLVIVALQRYFDGAWNEAVYEKVLSAPGAEVASQRSLEAWRLSHYEYTTPGKAQVRLPLDRAKELFLAEAAAGKTFYPAKATAPKIEEDAKKPEAAAADKGKEAAK